MPGSFKNTDGAGSQTKRPPGKYRGAKLPLTKDQYLQLRAYLSYDIPRYPEATLGAIMRIRAVRDLALLSTAIGTCLRASDLLSLTIGQVGILGVSPAKGFDIIERKTKTHLWIDLGHTAVDDLTRWVKCYDHAVGPLQPDAPLWPVFYAGTWLKTPLSYTRWHELVKSWVVRLDLDDRRYGSHSLRATLPCYYYEFFGDALGTQALFGHKRLSTTEIYLREVTKAKASQIRKADLLDQEEEPLDD